MSKVDARLVPVEYEIAGCQDDTVAPPRIVRHTSCFYAGVRWAVKWRRYCLNTAGEWEYEPLPSSRDDAFYARCRFLSLEAALRGFLAHRDPDVPQVKETKR